MHLVFDLLDDVRRSGGDELHYVRAKLTGGGINNLKFFFYADGEAVSHEVALRNLGLWGLLSAYHTALMGKLHLAGEFGGEVLEQRAHRRSATLIISRKKTGL